jgi:hypothetical protein
MTARVRLLSFHLKAKNNSLHNSPTFQPAK